MLQLAHRKSYTPIDIGPVVNKLAVGIALDELHFLVEQTVETHVFKSASFFEKPQISLVFRAQVNHRSVRTHRELEGTIEWPFHLVHIDI